MCRFCPREGYLASAADPAGLVHDDHFGIGTAFALIAQYGSLAAAEAALMEAHDETQD